MEQEPLTEQKVLDAALMRLTRLREEMVTSPTNCHANAARSINGKIHQLRARVAELEVEKEQLRKKRARSLSVPAPDLPGSLSQSIVPLQHPARDR